MLCFRFEPSRPRGAVRIGTRVPNAVEWPNAGHLLLSWEVLFVLSPAVVQRFAVGRCGWGGISPPLCILTIVQLKNLDAELLTSSQELKPKLRMRVSNYRSDFMAIEREYQNGVRAGQGWRPRAHVMRATCCVSSGLGGAIMLAHHVQYMRISFPPT